ncbi:MAG: hypothetical protein SAL07_24190 [Oscillatoria sp. PMC 1051.18]|nr:hypothetical protein [Oscillatoria sp. PMC 1050.18]MEC5033011.1 hypothetical protein [Oscillatoria sp. PMC 1051.18]
MLRTFNAILKGNSLEWVDDAPQMSDRAIQVQVTFLENPGETSDRDRTSKMAEVLEKLAQIKAFAEVNPETWQREVRQERSLPYREE